MARRIVAFADVLGFKDLVENVPHEELMEIYRELQLAVRLQTTAPVFPENHRRFEEEPYYEGEEIARRRLVNVVMASDSIVVYSAADAYGDALVVAQAVRALLVAGFRNGIALRGALAVGELDELSLEDDTLDGQNWTARFQGLVGVGLVHAYNLEAQCNWSGAILHPCLVAHLDALVLGEHEDGALTALDFCSSANLALESAVPVKSRDAHGQIRTVHETHWAINWPLLADVSEGPITEDQVARAFTSFGRTASSADIETKRDETLEFMRRANPEGLRRADDYT